MTFKDLLVHVDETKACAARVRAAIDLAIAHEAHLTAVYVVTDSSPTTFVQGYMPPEMLEMMQREARERADAALGRFAEEARRNHISFETRVDRVPYPAIAQALATHARYADVAILGQADPDDGGMPPSLPEEVTLASGRPSLVIPYIGPAATLGQRVTVAWDAGREAARAVNDALPLLKRAEVVGVVTVNPQERPFGHGEQPGADIALHLARHGIKVEVQRVESRDIDVPNAILSHIADQGSDLLVMGAYGHSRLRELVLGGVTRTILSDMTVPVFMAH
ncbi:MAG TPA: universal stress protein [Geminicoccaceae bacterium]|nr:universal stress protein [Geminicoccaceae bacterium]